MRMVRVRLSMAMTEQEVISSGLHWSSFMLHTIPAADQAERKRNIRQESNILTWTQRLQSVSSLLTVWSYLEVLVGVAAEENDEEAADGEALDTEPDW